MDTWNNDYLDLVEPAFVHFGAEGGAFVFGAVKCLLDVRDGVRDRTARVEFSREGFSDADPASGRGGAALGTAGWLVGNFFVHNSECLGFVAERE